MTNKKPVTKLTLVSAVVALMLCVAMLMGTTYAWFTDSVTSAGNIIKTGKLDIDLLVWDKTQEKYVSVKENSTPIWNYEKWEPGYTSWVNAKVETDGNLALRYTMRIVVDGDIGTLGDVIEVYYAPSEVEQPADRSLAGLTYLCTLNQAIDGTFIINDTLIPVPKSGETLNKEDFATLALHMREDAGNEYQEKQIGAKFSLQILATQLDYESDSFGPDYDENADGQPDNYPWPHISYGVNKNDETEQYGSVAAIHDALAAGKSVKLLADLDLDGYEWTPVEGYAGTFDGSGHTISNLTLTGDNSTVALFGSLEDGAAVKNIKFENVNVSGIYAAVVIGDAGNADNITIQNIEIVSGSVSATVFAAAIAYDAEGSNVTFTDCVNRATITSNYSASGIGAWITPTSGTINNLVNYGDVTGGNRAGGIFGNWKGAKISSSENHGNVKSTGDMPAGGIVGVASVAGTIENCINTGNVTTTAKNINASAAGILGQTSSGAITIAYCINTGNITAENSYAGGIATSLYGDTTSKYCYNSGGVTGNNTIGHNPIHAAGGIAPKAAYGNADKAQYCLNAGVISANTNGAVCQLAYSNITSSFYYENGVLKTSSGEDADIETVLAALNAGLDNPFFGIDNGIIKPIALIG